MNLVKWLRKNNKKVMAVVVIVIMVGFIGGAYIQQLGRRRTGLHKTIAYFADDKKITNYDRILAGRDLETLRLVGTNALLSNAQDLRAILLGELLFSERRTSPILIRRIKQIIGANRFSITSKQINDIYRRPMASDIYWLLLKNEAQLAGIRVSNEDAGKLLARTVPRLFNGATYSQVIGPLVNRRGIPEEEILATVGKLLAVLEYSRMICSNEDVTTSQIMHNVSWEEERIDVEFVKFESSVFAETQNEPNEQRIVEHFDKYKKFFAGAVSEENPYGFGYKLPDGVRLEYLAVKLDDISGIVKAPTQEEAEKYYQRHRDRFTEQVLSDPNDPNSPLTERTKSYAELASLISNQLLQDKIDLKAEKILQEAKTLTEAGFDDVDIEDANLSAEQFRQMTGDYESAAGQLSKEHKIKLYAGRTGLLSATDMQVDEYLGRLYLKGFGYNLVGLPQVVFAIDELQASELGPFDVPKPRMYENIGPIRDMLRQITVVVRVIEAEKASEPESINQTFGKNTLKLEQTEEQVGEEDPNRDEGPLGTQDFYSVREQVVEDLKKLAAMAPTKSKAEEFIRQVVEDGWEGAIDKFNELYGQADRHDEADPNVFKLQDLAGLQRISSMELGIVAARSAGNPALQFSVDSAQKERQLRAHLYSLVPQDANTLDTVPKIVEFKPDMSYYCLKSMSVKRLSQDEYEKLKVIRIYKEDVIQSQSLAPVHFNPENIIKRMNFRWVEKEKQTPDADTPVPNDSVGEEAA